MILEVEGQPFHNLVGKVCRRFGQRVHQHNPHVLNLIAAQFISVKEFQ